MKTKMKVSLSIDKDVKHKISNIGEKYGMNLSNIVERAVRYYIDDFELDLADNKDAHESYISTGDENRISLEDLKKKYDLES